MKPSHPTGLGEPEVIGKQALFRPPVKSALKNESPRSRDDVANVEKRFRMTIEITRSGLETIQMFQSKHQLLTGEFLPKWQIIEDALRLYRRKKEEKHEHPDQ